MWAETLRLTLLPLQAEWPQAYWEVLASLQQGQAVTIPRPHAKFDVADMQRVAEQVQGSRGEASQGLEQELKGLPRFQGGGAASLSLF